MGESKQSLIDRNWEDLFILSCVLTSREQKAKYQDKSISLQQNQSVSVTNKRRSKEDIEIYRFVGQKRNQRAQFKEI